MDADEFGTCKRLKALRLNVAEPATANQAGREAGMANPGRSGIWDTVRLVFEEGVSGPLPVRSDHACNANCGFGNFAREQLPKSHWQSVEREGALDAIDILFRHGIRYLVLTGGEPTLHPSVTAIIRHAADKMSKVVLVTNGGVLKPHRIREFADAGLSSFVISVDASSEEAYERNRGWPGAAWPTRRSLASVCKRRPR
jgi:hypothetical protein